MEIPDILKKIIETKREEVAALKASAAIGELKARAADAPPPRAFLKALKSRAEETGHPALIAEVKKASPSKGVIREDFDPVWIARRYAAGGAACLSVLTDEKFFQGSLKYMEAVRAALSLPVLRKDFIIDRAQLHEARAAGADCILLIAACLEPAALHDLHEEARAIGLDVLVEIHGRGEWEGIITAGKAPPLVGINNRDLRDFSVSLETTRELAPDVLKHRSLLVAESGIFTPEDVATLKKAGATAILVGESLMRQTDPGQAAADLLRR